MSGNGLLPAGHRVEVDIVTASVTVRNTALMLKLANEFAALHKAISLVW